LAVLGQLEALAVVELGAAAAVVLDEAGAELDVLADELVELLPQADTASVVTAIKSSASRRLRGLTERGGIGARG
jgi:hypothetical protein